MTELSDAQLRQDLLERLVDAKLVGPNLQINFNCEPEGLGEETATRQCGSAIPVVCVLVQRRERRAGRAHCVLSDGQAVELLSQIP